MVFEDPNYDDEVRTGAYHEEVHDLAGLIHILQVKLATAEIARWMCREGNADRIRGLETDHAINLINDEIKGVTDKGLLILDELIIYIQELHDEAKELTKPYDEAEERRETEQELYREHRN